MKITFNNKTKMLSIPAQVGRDAIEYLLPGFENSKIMGTRETMHNSFIFLGGEKSGVTTACSVTVDATNHLKVRHSFYPIEGAGPIVYYANNPPGRSVLCDNRGVYKLSRGQWELNLTTTQDLVGCDYDPIGEIFVAVSKRTLFIHYKGEVMEIPNKSKADFVGVEYYGKSVTGDFRLNYSDSEVEGWVMNNSVGRPEIHLSSKKNSN